MLCGLGKVWICLCECVCVCVRSTSFTSPDSENGLELDLRSILLFLSSFSPLNSHCCVVCIDSSLQSLVIHTSTAGCGDLVPAAHAHWGCSLSHEANPGFEFHSHIPLHFVFTYFFFFKPSDFSSLNKICKPGRQRVRRSSGLEWSCRRHNEMVIHEDISAAW